MRWSAMFVFVLCLLLSACGSGTIVPTLGPPPTLLGFFRRLFVYRAEPVMVEAGTDE